MTGLKPGDKAVIDHIDRVFKAWLELSKSMVAIQNWRREAFTDRDPALAAPADVAKAERLTAAIREVIGGE